MLRESSFDPTSLAQASQRSNQWFMLALRLLFVLALIGVGWSLASEERHVRGLLFGQSDLVVIAFTGLGLIVIAIDIFIPRKSLASMSGLFFGLVVGMVVAYGLSLIIDFIFGIGADTISELTASQRALISASKLAVGVICCYLAVSFILQTKDDVRFVIPYVEFSKETKGSKPLVLDTSAIIDGRIADIVSTRILDSQLIVPRFVLLELQTIADSADKLKRARGRRGLDMLNKLQTDEQIDISILDIRLERPADNAGVDEMLVDLAMQLEGKVVTNDFNLNKVAQLRGVTVVNINDLANALKPVVLPGEMMTVKVVKPGEEAGQGVGYLDDGTMVVAEGAREHVGETVDLTITSVLQTSAGRMIFGRLDGTPSADKRRPR